MVNSLETYRIRRRGLRPRLRMRHVSNELTFWLSVAVFATAQGLTSWGGASACKTSKGKKRSDLLYQQLSFIHVFIYFTDLSTQAALSNHPAEVIALIILTIYLVSVWSMRTCELYYTDMPEIQSVSEAMWLSAITFLTVGYGDLTPKTLCGRFIAVATGLVFCANTRYMACWTVILCFTAYSRKVRKDSPAREVLVTCSQDMIYLISGLSAS